MVLKITKKQLINKSHGQQYEAFKAVKKLDGIFNLKTGFSVIV